MLIQLLTALVLAGSGVTARGGVVTGHVTDITTSTPVPSARIILRGQQGNVTAATVTRNDGSYRIADVPAGVYAVQATRIGYAPKTVADVIVRVDETRVVDFLMSAVPRIADAVVVVGARRTEKVADADVAVSVVDEQTIAQRQSPTLQGALRDVPGVDYFETGLGQQQANTRGFVSVMGSNMLVLVDGRLAAAPGHNMPLSGFVVAPVDVARAEVVAGPTSALYGANAASGVLNIVTIDPAANPGGTLVLGGGDRNVWHMAGRQAGMLSDRLGYKVTFEDLTGKDFEKYNVFQGIDPRTGTVIAQRSDAPDFDVKNRSMGAGLYFYPNAGSRIAYTGGYTNASYINLTNVARLQMDGWSSWYHQLRGQWSRSGMGSLFVNAAVTGNDAGDSYYLDMESRFQFPKTVAGGLGVSPDSARTLARFADRSRRVEVGAQHFFNIAGRQFITSGVDWRRSMPNSDGVWLSDGPNGSPVRIDEVGVYGQYEALLAESLRLTLAARYDDHSVLGGTLSPKAALMWHVTPEQTLRASVNRATNAPMPYLLFARSFIVQRGPYAMWNRGGRLGWDFVNVNGGPVPASIDPLKSIDVTSWEIGWRGEFATRLTTDVSAYTATYKNFQTSAIELNNPLAGVFAVDRATGDTLREYTRSFVNYGELPVVGVDASAQVAVMDRLRVKGSVSYQEPQTFRSARTDLPTPGFNVPLAKWKAGASYDGLLVHRSSIEASVVHVNKFFYQSGLAYTTGWVPAYTNVDLDATVPIPQLPRGDFAALVAVKNLFDSHHVELPGAATLERRLIVSLSTTWR